MNSSLAPIVLFTYNRPTHTRKVLDSLALNNESKNSLLYIFCDGPKEDANTENIEKILATRVIVNSENRFEKVIIRENSINKGLANSIIDGVTEIVNQHGNIIVLEDDIVPSPGFLAYMNNALTIYAQQENVGCIHAWNYHLNLDGFKESTFFLKGSDCWGWAAWKRSWDLFNPDGQYLLDIIESQKLEYEINRRGTHDFVNMLKDQILGKNDSWAIRWYISLFVKDKYCLHPARPIVNNIGFDNTGVHCGLLDMVQDPVNFIELKEIDICESEWFFNAYSDLLKEKERLAKKNIKLRLKSFLKKIMYGK